MNKNRFVLPIILLLLCVFIPLSIYGAISHKNLKPDSDNPNHLHKFNNKLYFYDDNSNLIGIYNCESEACDDAQNNVDDEYLNYYKGSDNTLPIIDNMFAFIKDGDSIKYHNIKSNKTIATYSQIKNYGSNLGEGYLIIANDQGFNGLFDIKNGNYKIEFAYDFMGVNKHYYNSGDDEIRFVVDEGGKWYIIDIDNKKLSKEIKGNIYDYNEKFVYTKKNDNEKVEYVIYDYDGKRVLNNLKVITFYYFEKYNVVTTEDGSVIVYDETFTKDIRTFKEEGKRLNFKADGPELEIVDDSGKNYKNYELGEDEE